MHMRSPPLEIYYRGPKDRYEDFWSPWSDEQPGDYRRFMRLTPAERKEVYDRIVSPLSVVPDEYPCVWLDLQNGCCGKYDARPDVCRDFEIGSDACLTHRRNARIQ